MKYSQFRRWLENLGIELSKGKGSHWVAHIVFHAQHAPERAAGNFLIINTLRHV